MGDDTNAAGLALLFLDYLMQPTLGGIEKEWRQCAHLGTNLEPLGGKVFERVRKLQLVRGELTNAIQPVKHRIHRAGRLSCD